MNLLGVCGEPHQVILGPREPVSVGLAHVSRSNNHETVQLSAPPAVARTIADWFAVDAGSDAGGTGAQGIGAIRFAGVIVKLPRSSSPLEISETRIAVVAPATAPTR